MVLLCGHAPEMMGWPRPSTPTPTTTNPTPPQGHGSLLLEGASAGGREQGRERGEARRGGGARGADSPVSPQNPEMKSELSARPGILARIFSASARYACVGSGGCGCGCVGGWVGGWLGRGRGWRAGEAGGGGRREEWRREGARGARLPGVAAAHPLEDRGAPALRRQVHLRTGEGATPRAVRGGCAARPALPRLRAQGCPGGGRGSRPGRPGPRRACRQMPGCAAIASRTPSGKSCGRRLPWAMHRRFRPEGRGGRGGGAAGRRRAPSGAGR